MPVDQQEFRRWLRIGLGRAFLHVRNHDASMFREAILDACLHCQAFDPQENGTRAEWMLELIAPLPDRRFFENEVLTALDNFSDSWDDAQRFSIAWRLTETNPAARDAMYRAYRPGPRFGTDLAFYFLQMDGADGLRFVVDRLAQAWAEGVTFFDLSYLRYLANEQLGKAKVAELFETWSAADPKVAAFLNATRSGEGSNRRFLGGLPFQEAITAARSAPKTRTGQSQMRGWGSKADPGQLQEAIEALRASSEPAEQALLLSAFPHRAFPASPLLLLPFANSPHETVAQAACTALSNINPAEPQPAIRDFAIQLVAGASSLRSYAVRILARHAKPGDHQRALDWFLTEHNDRHQHPIGRDLLEFWKLNPEPASEPAMLRAVYENQPCGFCRQRGVERMMELDLLTEELREECLWDSNEEIRELITSEAT